MTIKQLQELYFISQGDQLDFDKSIKMVGVLTGKTPEQVELLPMLKFNKLCKKIVDAFAIFGEKLKIGKPNKLIYVKRRFYRLNYDLQKASKYVEGVTFAADLIADLHKLMATIAEPVTWYGKGLKRSHNEIAKDMEHVNFEIAYHCAVFFCLEYQILMQLIRPYLIAEAKAKGVPEIQTAEALNNLQSILDGYTMPNWSQSLKEYLSLRFGI